MRLTALSVGLVLLAVNVHWQRPFFNWDMLAYVAIALELGGESPTEAHRRTYELARQVVPAREYGWITEYSEYRRTLASDPEAFQQQLPFYSVKPAYPALIYTLSRVGVDPVRASVYISQAAYLAIGVLLLAWLSTFLGPLAAIATAWAAMSFQVALDLAALSTPDALSTLVVLAALWAVFGRDRPRVGLALLVLSITIRPDNLIWLIAVGIYSAIRFPDKRAFAGTLALAGLALYFALASWSGNLGWQVLFHHSFVERLAYPETFTPTIDLGQYLWVYLGRTHPVNLPTFVAPFALVGAWTFVARLRRHGWSDAGVCFFLVAAAFAAAHWLVYPGEDRFLVPAYLATLVMLVRTIAEFAGSRRDAQPLAPPGTVRG